MPLCIAIRGCEFQKGRLEALNLTAVSRCVLLVAGVSKQRLTHQWPSGRTGLRAPGNQNHAPQSVLSGCLSSLLFFGLPRRRSWEGVCAGASVESVSFFSLICLLAAGFLASRASIYEVHSTVRGQTPCCVFPAFLPSPLQYICSATAQQAQQEKYANNLCRHATTGFARLPCSLCKPVNPLPPKQLCAGWRRVALPGAVDSMSSARRNLVPQGQALALGLSVPRYPVLGNPW